MVFKILAQLLKKPIYKWIRDGKSGFYYQVPEDKVLIQSNVTSLVTTSKIPLFSSELTDRSSVVLGTAENADGRHILQLDADSNIRLTFSQIGDGNKM